MGLPIIGDVIDAVKDIVSEVVVDKDQRNQINLELSKLENDRLLGQVEINKVEAASDSLFVSGWRPFIGWVAGGGVAWTFVLSPFVEFISRLLGWKGVMPELDANQLMALITAMLGVAGYRTYEKVQGVARDTLNTKKEEPQINEAPLKKKKKFKIF